MVPTLSVIDGPKTAGSVARMPAAIPPSRSSSESAEASFAISSKKQFLDPKDWLRSAEAVASAADNAAGEIGTSTAWARALQANAVIENVEGVARAAKEVLQCLGTGRAKSNDQALFKLAAISLIRAGEHDALRESLANMPDRISTTPAQVMMLAREGDFSSAYELLEAEGSDSELSLRGYIELQLGKTHEAIRTLRRAVSEDLAGPDDRINLALALWRAGSRRKGARMALSATRMAPGRRDISLDAMRFLLADGNFELVKREIADLRSRRVTEDSEFRRLEIDYLDASGQPERGIRKIADLLRSFKVSEQDRKELEALSGLFKSRVGTLRKDESFELTLAALKLQPTNHVLVDWLIEVTDRKSEVKLARPYLEQVQSEFSEENQLQLMTQLALAEEDFETAFDLSKQLRAKDPESEYAVSSEFMLSGHLRDDWSPGVAWFLRAIQRETPLSAFLVNQGAFILASAGRGLEALELVSWVPNPDFQLRATAGLAKMACGEFAEGMRDYRSAFEVVPSGSVGDSNRALMAIYQGQALYRLGLIRNLPMDVIRANALPLSEIPETWAHSSSFALLKVCAIRNGWPWPTLVS